MARERRVAEDVPECEEVGGLAVFLVEIKKATRGSSHSVNVLGNLVHQFWCVNSGRFEAMATDRFTP
jgi:hypothetical protein